MTDGAYTRLRNMMDSPSYDVPLRVRQPLKDVLDAYQRAVEALEHELLGAREQVLDEARKMGVPDA